MLSTRWARSASGCSRLPLGVETSSASCARRDGTCWAMGAVAWLQRRHLFLCTSTRTIGVPVVKTTTLQRQLYFSLLFSITFIIFGLFFSPSSVIPGTIVLVVTQIRGDVLIADSSSSPLRFVPGFVIGIRFPLLPSPTRVRDAVAWKYSGLIVPLIKYLVPFSQSDRVNSYPRKIHCQHATATGVPLPFSCIRSAYRTWYSY